MLFVQSLCGFVVEEAGAYDIDVADFCLPNETTSYTQEHNPLSIQPHKSARTLKQHIHAFLLSSLQFTVYIPLERQFFGHFRMEKHSSLQVTHRD